MTLVGIGAFLLVVFGAKALYTHNVSRPAPIALAPAPALHVSTRTWRAIARDPAGNIGARVVLWGQVTGLDRAPGAASIRANVDAARHRPENGTVNYPTSVILYGDPDVLGKAAEGYIFTAEATVDATSAAGGATVPSLTVTKLTITDKTVG